MKIVITETSAAETLSIIDPKSGVNYIADFIGNTGALNDGQFTWDDKRDAYACTQDTFDWWKSVVTANQALDDRINALVQEHGHDAVYEVIHALPGVDLGDHASHTNQALDKAFGPAE